jgi:hypothetical protein
VLERVLREQPNVLGVAGPKMPIGSPGIEVSGRPPDRYDVFTCELICPRHPILKRSESDEECSERDDPVRRLL